MSPQKIGWIKIIAITVIAILLLGLAWFARNQIEYSRWWNSLPPDSEQKNIEDTSENPVLVFLRRGFRWQRFEETEGVQEPEHSIAELREAVRQLEENSEKMQSDIEDIKIYKSIQEQEQTQAAIRRVEMNKKPEEKPTIPEDGGSSISEVRSIQGSPDRTEVIEGETWYFYGTSYIQFDEGGMVKCVYNTGDLKNFPAKSNSQSYRRHQVNIY